MSDVPTHYENSGNEIPHWQRMIMARKRAEKLIADEERNLIVGGLEKAYPLLA